MQAAILRSQLKQAVMEKEQQKSRSARSTEASERQFQEQLLELMKKKESLELKLKFEVGKLFYFSVVGLNCLRQTLLDFLGS